MIIFVIKEAHKNKNKTNVIGPWLHLIFYLIVGHENYLTKLFSQLSWKYKLETPEFWSIWIAQSTNIVFKYNFLIQFFIFEQCSMKVEWLFFFSFLGLLISCYKVFCALFSNFVKCNYISSKCFFYQFKLLNYWTFLM